MIDCLINGLLIAVGLVFTYVIITVFTAGIAALNKGDEDE